MCFVMLLEHIKKLWIYLSDTAKDVLIDFDIFSKFVFIWFRINRSLDTISWYYLLGHTTHYHSTHQNDCTTKQVAEQGHEVTYGSIRWSAHNKAELSNTKFLTETIWRFIILTMNAAAWTHGVFSSGLQGNSWPRRQHNQHKSWIYFWM